MKKNTIGLYEISVITFFAIIPVSMIIFEQFFLNNSLSFFELSLKWFVFSGVGLRLGSSGIKQIVDPCFTATTIFGIKDEKAYVLVKEIGFANVSFSLIALLSIVFAAFRIPAAITGGTYFLLAGLLHVFKEKESEEEVFAMVSDLSIATILLFLTIVNI